MGYDPALGITEKRYGYLSRIPSAELWARFEIENWRAVIYKYKRQLNGKRVLSKAEIGVAKANIKNAKKYIAVLKKQVPAPFWEAPENDYYIAGYCSKCGTTGGAKYCRWCGQRLKVFNNDR